MYRERQKERGLNFTGNWFIDAGILGFVNLMEEVYGWDLKELQKRISEDEEKIYYGLFPLAYLFYNSKLRPIFSKINEAQQEIFGKGKSKKGILNKIKEKKEELKKIEKEIELDKGMKKFKKKERRKRKIDKEIQELNKKLDKKNEEINGLKDKINEEKRIFYTKFIKEDGEESEKVKNYFNNFELKTPMIGRNFFLFNSDAFALKKNPLNASLNALKYIRFLIMISRSKKEAREKFKKFVSDISTKKRKEGLTYEISPDSTINPFLYSPSQFPNIGYTLPLSIKEIENSIKLKIPIYILLLCFQHAFQPVSGKNIMFYTNNLGLSYGVNKKLMTKMNIVKERKRDNIFHLTWLSIIDELIENKASFSLENMYIIEFNMETSKLSNVEYIGVSKLHASFLIDDIIREALNVYLQVDDRGKKVWLLEEFIKNNRLLPIFYKNLRLYFNGKIEFVPKKYMIYSSALDKSILDLEEGSSELFSDIFFNRYRKVIDNAKRYARKLFSISHIIDSTFTNLSEDKKKNLAYTLFTKVMKNQKYPFVNIVLKELNQIDNKEHIEEIIRFLFDYILNDDKTWQQSAVPIIIGLIYKGGDNGESDNNK